MKNELLTYKDIVNYVKEEFGTDLEFTGSEEYPQFLNYISIKDLRALVKEIILYSYHGILNNVEGDLNKLHELIESFKTPGNIDALYSLRDNEILSLTNEKALELYKQPAISTLSRYYMEVISKVQMEHAHQTLLDEALIKPATMEDAINAFKAFYPIVEAGLMEIFIEKYDSKKDFDSIIDLIMEEMIGFFEKEDRDTLEIYVNAADIKYFNLTLQRVISYRVMPTLAFPSATAVLKCLFSVGASPKALYDVIMEHNQIEMNNTEVKDNK